jgi:hypothetical protein
VLTELSAGAVRQSRALQSLGKVENGARNGAGKGVSRRRTVPPAPIPPPADAP